MTSTLLVSLVCIALMFNGEVAMSSRVPDLFDPDLPLLAELPDSAQEEAASVIVGMLVAVMEAERSPVIDADEADDLHVKEVVR